mmetsp:Transcript_118616/g.330920  ORF Transcript_118616/g.330920 Transcript_118616/m.330920 type:complete len:243 (+) Transcript_118616:713-1441(+)
MDVRAQGVEGALAPVHLDCLVEGGARLDRYGVVAEEDVVAHESAGQQLRDGRLACDELGKVSLAVVLQVVGVEVVVRLAGQGRRVFQALASLQHIVHLEAQVVDLGKPLHRHVLGEHPGIAARLGEEEDHVLHKRPAEDIVVLEGRPLVEQLVVLARGAAAVELLPLHLQLGLLLRIVLLALRILDCTAEMVVVKVVLLDKRLPILVGIQPLRLGKEGDRRILEGDPKRPRSVPQDVLGLLH